MATRGSKLTSEQAYLKRATDKYAALLEKSYRESEEFMQNIEDDQLDATMKKLSTFVETFGHSLSKFEGGSRSFALAFENPTKDIECSIDSYLDISIQYATRYSELKSILAQLKEARAGQQAPINPVSTAAATAVQPDSERILVQQMESLMKMHEETQKQTQRLIANQVQASSVQRISQPQHAEKLRVNLPKLSLPKF